MKLFKQLSAVVSRLFWSWRGISNVVRKTHVNFELLQYQLGNLFTSNKYRRIFSVKGLFGFIISEIGFI